MINQIFAIIRNIKQLFSNFLSIPLKCVELLVNVAFLTFFNKQSNVGRTLYFSCFPIFMPKKKLKGNFCLIFFLKIRYDALTCKEH